MMLLRPQINYVPTKSHVIVLFTSCIKVTVSFLSKKYRIKFCDRPLKLDLFLFPLQAKWFYTREIFFWRRISWEHHHMQWEINKRSLTGLLPTFLLLFLVIGWKLWCHFLNQFGQKWNQNEPFLSHMPFPAPAPRCDCIVRDLIVHWFICTCDWSK